MKNAGGFSLGGARKYWSYFKMRFVTGLQYRLAALAGIATQFAWGGLSILLYRAFYQVDAAAFPMSFAQLANYIWLQQAFLALHMSWIFDNDVLSSIETGSVAYELCRPAGIYAMWFSKTAAMRFSRALLRCMPILVVAALLPAPYGLSLPASPAAFVLFLFSLLLSVWVVVAMGMLIMISCFYTVSPRGTRSIFAALSDFLAGGVVPITFFPGAFRRVAELSPFGAMQNVPFRIYGGHLSGMQAAGGVALQMFWALALTALGVWLLSRVTKRLVVQGG